MPVTNPDADYGSASTDEGSPRTVHNPTDPNYWMNSATGVLKGAVKEVGKQMTDIPNQGGLFGKDSGVFPQVGQTIHDWSNSPGDSPNAEAVGRFGADIAPMFLLPQDMALNAFNEARMLGPIIRGGKFARKVIGFGENMAKGAIGGASQNPNDPGQGAAGGTLAGAAVSALPAAARGLGHVVQPMAVMGDIMRVGQHVPYWALYHSPSALNALARAAKFLGAAPIGAGVERWRQQGQRPSSPDAPTLTPDK